MSGVRVLVVADSDFRQQLDGGHNENHAFFASLVKCCSVVGVVVTSGRHRIPQVGLFAPGVPGLWVPRRGVLGSAWGVDPFVSASRPANPRVLAPFVRRVGEFDVVVLLSFKAFRVAQLVAGRLGKPIVLRGHNIERDYAAALVRAASGPRRAALAVEAARIGRFERLLQSHPSVTGVADITETDYNVRRQAIGAKAWLLPSFAFCHTTADAKPVVSTPTPGNIVFMGAFSNPTNTAGLQWFRHHVWPTVRTTTDTTCLTLVGRKPTDDITQWANADSRVRVIGDVPETAPYLAQAAIVINPVHTGSGINIKMAHYLTSRTPTVTTTKGARGLPTTVTEHLHIADTPTEFTTALQHLLRNPQHGTTQATAAAHATTQAFNLHDAETTLQKLLHHAGRHRTPRIIDITDTACHTNETP